MRWILSVSGILDGYSSELGSKKMAKNLLSHSWKMSLKQMHFLLSRVKKRLKIVGKISRKSCSEHHSDRRLFSDILDDRHSLHHRQKLSHSRHFSTLLISQSSRLCQLVIYQLVLSSMVPASEYKWNHIKIMRLLSEYLMHASELSLAFDIQLCLMFHLFLVRVFVHEIL